MNARILLAGLYHETHTFVGDITRTDAVRLRRGEELLARRGDASTVDGFLNVAARENWRVVPLLEIGAMPSGTLDHAVFEAFWTEFEPGARAAMDQGLDGVWLALHGAMVTTGSLDPEGELLARIRALPGFDRLPLFGVFDLHATFTPAMARHADALVGYRENPHIDAFDMAVYSAELLARSLKSGVRPCMVTRTLPLIWPPTGTGTADAPMRPMEMEARRIEATDPDIWVANVVGGYAFADTPDTGVSVSVVTTGSDAAAARHLDRLAAIAQAHRYDGVPREWTLDAAIDDALARGITGPVALVEPADNIGAGAPGDCTSILRVFLARRLPGAAVIMNDPRSVAALAGAGRRHLAAPDARRQQRARSRRRRGRGDAALALRRPLHARGPQQPPCGHAGHPHRHGAVRHRTGGRRRHPDYVEEDAAVRSRPIALARHRAGDAALRRRQGSGRAPARLRSHHRGELLGRHPRPLSERSHPAALPAPAPADLPARSALETAMTEPPTNSDLMVRSTPKRKLRRASNHGQGR